jgi:pimeloyl-ACP methyl ester carboxylesterase
MLSPPPAERATAWEARGLPPDVAADLSAATDETMGRCILALYRDAAQPAMVEAAAELPAAAARPGLVLIAADDPYVGTEAMARASAGLAGAAVTVLDGVGHWWMLQDPAKGARALEAFWSGN